MGREPAPDPSGKIGPLSTRLIAVGGSLALLALVLFLGLSPASPFTSEATRINIHTSEAFDASGFECSGCHLLQNPVPGRADLRTSVRAACLSCHEEQVAEEKLSQQHPPLVQGDCTACHRAHKTEEPDQLNAPVTALCLTCHGDKRADQALEYAHAPFARGQCTSCHSPHASETDGLLRGEAGELCLSCHQEVASRSLGRSLQHAPFAAGNCTSCHTPHASGVPGQLRAEPKEICLACHAGSIARMDAGHRPVAEGLCTSCHEPHASDVETLLRAPGAELCFMCHRK